MKVEPMNPSIDYEMRNHDPNRLALKLTEATAKMFLKK
jgi:hypothetical protein